jgi:hypothetical protein
METVAAARKMYRALRAATHELTAAQFDYEAGHLAHEEADGECVEPKHFVRGAQDVAHRYAARRAA